MLPFALVLATLPAPLPVPRSLLRAPSSVHSPPRSLWPSSDRPVRTRHARSIDVNQEGYLEEALKICNALAEFSNDPASSRDNVSIVGFREHIYSSLGTVAGFAASSEFVFGTMLQRVLDRPLVSRQYCARAVLGALATPTAPAARSSCRPPCMRAADACRPPLPPSWSGGVRSACAPCSLRALCHQHLTPPHCSPLRSLAARFHGYGRFRSARSRSSARLSDGHPGMCTVHSPGWRTPEQLSMILCLASLTPCACSPAPSLRVSSRCRHHG